MSEKKQVLSSIFTQKLWKTKFTRLFEINYEVNHQKKTYF